jgi:hypothetical protein
MIERSAVTPKNERFRKSAVAVPRTTAAGAEKIVKISEFGYQGIKDFAETM